MQLVLLKLGALADPAINTKYYSEILDLLSGVAYGKQGLSRIQLLLTIVPMAKRLAELERVINDAANFQKEAFAAKTAMPPLANMPGTTSGR